DLTFAQQCGLFVPDDANFRNAVYRIWIAIWKELGRPNELLQPAHPFTVRLFPFHQKGDTWPRNDAMNACRDVAQGGRTFYFSFMPVCSLGIVFSAFHPACDPALRPDWATLTEAQRQALRDAAPRQAFLLRFLFCPVL